MKEEIKLEVGSCLPNVATKCCNSGVVLYMKEKNHNHFACLTCDDKIDYSGIFHTNGVITDEAIKGIFQSNFNDLYKKFNYSEKINE